MTATARELRGLLFTDIVGSTEHAARLRDRAWRELLERHDELVAERVRDFGGRIATKAGDGVFAIFETPGQAVRCGQAACEAVRPLGIEVRAGVHFGECELSPQGPVGLAVHVAQRISALAGPGEVLVSGTVADLLAGSDLELVERGTHVLRGVPGEHRVFAAGDRVEAGGAAAAGAVRIVIGEDAYLIRESLRRLLASRPDVTVAAIREDLDGLVEAIEAERPDVVLTDIRMPPEHSDEGIRLAQLLRERSPGTGVVVLSQHAEPRYAIRLLAEGSEGRGYLLKERVSDADQLVAAIKEVARGGSVIDAKLVDALVGAKSVAEKSPLDELTPREREVLAEMAQGKNNAAIAESLVLTERAVEKHVGSIFTKLGLKWEESVNRRVKAVLIYLSEASS